ncbi:phosphotransferase [Kribbella sp.]|uniref:phosphotransferase n=1 Tax=Kribbella sp. TaxID=1871183 RepID=UPI002D6E8A89|nr:phosphotransferase [Kribbella sp.]HZX01713.1 phosphotransferase [Kribbella sp.]
MQIDRGAYPDARTPWDDPAWRATALGWLDAELARIGVRELGERRVRVRPWSVIVRVEAADPVWFKAGAPGAAFEAGLGEALARWTPEHVLTPYAVDAARGWSLMPSGGDQLRVLPPGPREWIDVLTQYAELQRALVPRVDELLRLGVPDARVPALPGIFDAAVLETSTADKLSGLRPRLVGWCEELRAIGVPDSLDHADLHDGQILVAGVGRYTFFDWGDANVGHPFFSLLVTLERAAELHGPEVVARLEDAYLEAWTADGHTLPDLRRAAELARRLSQLTRAGSWARLFPDATHLGVPHRAAALLRLRPTG